MADFTVSGLLLELGAAKPQLLSDPNPRYHPFLQTRSASGALPIKSIRTGRNGGCPLLD